jgi:SAM-dependent methyltransferase
LEREEETEEKELTEEAVGLLDERGTRYDPPPIGRLLAPVFFVMTCVLLAATLGLFLRSRHPGASGGALSLASPNPGSSRSLGVTLLPRSTSPGESFEWPLVADSPRITPWQKFRKFKNETGLLCLQTIHGRFVTVQPDGRVTGDATAMGEWQMLAFVANTGGTISFKTWTGNYIMADADGHLNANAASISAPETFLEIDNHDGSVSYKTARDKYMTAVRLQIQHSSLTGMEKTFESMYDESDGQVGSGYESLPEDTGGYLRFLKGFLKDHHIHSLVDVGCGDWRFSHLMNWTGANYLGIDIAENVIKQDKLKYEKAGVHFRQGSLTDELPVADLLIAREVLEHLPFDVIFTFLETNVLIGRYGYVLVTNKMLQPGKANADAKVNGQVHARGLNLSTLPFNVLGLQEVYRHGETQTVLLSQPEKHEGFVEARRALGIMG